MKKIYVAIVILVLLGLSLYLMEGDVKGNKKGDKKSDEKGDKKSDEKGDKESDEKDDICHHIYDDICNIPFDKCVKCDRDGDRDGQILYKSCRYSEDDSFKNCLHYKDNLYKDAFCRSNKNATYDECQSVNYEHVYCHNNPKAKNNKKCTDDKDKDKINPINVGYCVNNPKANYKDCQSNGYENDYCARNPKVVRNTTGMENCCPSTTKYQKDYLENYINNYVPKPFIPPNIKLSLQTPEEINAYACTLRENCKNIVVTPENVYPARPLCSNITIGYNEKDSNKYNFSDSICKNITQLVEKKFNNIYLADPIEDDQEGDRKDGHVGKIKDGVYTFNDYEGNKHIYNYSNDGWMNEAIKNKIIQNEYDNLIREYCYCLDLKPEICKLFFNDVKSKVKN